MSKVNVKLMQGIEEAEGQVARDREAREVHASEADRNKEVPEKFPDKVKPGSDAQREPFTEYLKEQRKPKGKNTAVNEEKRDFKKSNKKQVFSFRAVISDINVWKAYATATGRTMESIGTDAMNEYMKKHRMSDAEAAVFRALLDKYEGR